MQSPPHLTGANKIPTPQKQKPPQGSGGFCKNESGVYGHRPGGRTCSRFVGQRRGRSAGAVSDMAAVFFRSIYFAYANSFSILSVHLA